MLERGDGEFMLLYLIGCTTLAPIPNLNIYKAKQITATTYLNDISLEPKRKEQQKQQLSFHVNVQLKTL